MVGKEGPSDRGGSEMVDMWVGHGAEGSGCVGVGSESGRKEVGERGNVLMWGEDVPMGGVSGVIREIGEVWEEFETFSTGFGTAGGEGDGTAGGSDAESAGMGGTIAPGDWAMGCTLGGGAGGGPAAGAPPEGAVGGQGSWGAVAADPSLGCWWALRLARRQGRSGNRMGPRCVAWARAARNLATAGSAHCARRARWRARTRGGSRWAAAPFTTTNKTLVA